MRAYWLKFNDRLPGCVEANNEDDAKSVAKEATGSEPTSCQTLPYPAEPRINRHKDPKYGACPSFCYEPKKCAGVTSCPQNYSCVE